MPDLILSDDLGLLGTFYCTLPCLCLLLTLTVQCCYKGTNGCISSLPTMTVAQRSTVPILCGLVVYSCSYCTTVTSVVTLRCGFIYSTPLANGSLRFFSTTLLIFTSDF